MKIGNERHLGWGRSSFLGGATDCDDGEGGGK